MVYSVNELHIFDDLNHLSRSLAALIADIVRERVTSADRFEFVLSGGSTPKPLYTLLAEQYGDLLPWEQIHLYVGDERYVPHDDLESNFGTIQDILFSKIPIPETNLHPIPTHLDTARENAELFQSRLRERFTAEYPRFDIILLGIGKDGHIASLFPGTQALNERERWVTASHSPEPPRERITLTYPVLNNARYLFFIGSGGEKSVPVKKALTGNIPRDECPAAYVQPSRGRSGWWLDREAAHLLLSLPMAEEK